MKSKSLDTKDVTPVTSLLKALSSRKKPSEKVLSSLLLVALKHLHDLGLEKDQVALVTEGFDADGIWAQLHMNYPSKIDSELKEIFEIAKSSVPDHGEGEVGDAADLSEVESDQEMEENAESEEEEGSEESEGLEEEVEEELEEMESASESEIPRPKLRKSKRDTTEVDDKFFSLEEMEKFAAEYEARDIRRAQGKDDEVEFDFDQDPDDSDDDNVDIMYADFFDPPQQDTQGSPRSNTFSDSEDGSEKASEDLEQGSEEYDSDAAELDLPDHEDNLSDDLDKDFEAKFSSAPKSFNLFEDEDTKVDEMSRFERMQKAMEKQIKDLEKDAISDKHWSLKGEIASKARPVNSLLEEDVEVEHVAKPIPVITEETTLSLEDLIRQRIKDGLFDDVERKVDPNSILQAKGAFDPNRNQVLDEKPKQSLAETYETEYLKQLTGNRQTEKDAALQAQHVDIDTLFKQLCHDLDTLSNFHFTPKAPKLELQVQANSVPAIEMEEVVPIAVSDALLTAPEEIYQKPRTDKDLKTSAELQSGEKKRIRAKNKRKAKQEKQGREEMREALSKADPVLAAKLNKKSVKDDKKQAMDSLMKQGNVTIVGKTSGKRKAGGARIIEAGTSAKKPRLEVNPKHLKL